MEMPKAARLRRCSANDSERRWSTPPVSPPTVPMGGTTLASHTCIIAMSASRLARFPRSARASNASHDSELKSVATSLFRSSKARLKAAASRDSLRRRDSERVEFAAALRRGVEFVRLKRVGQIAKERALVELERLGAPLCCCLAPPFRSRIRPHLPEKARRRFADQLHRTRRSQPDAEGAHLMKRLA